MFNLIDRFGSFMKNWSISKKVLATIFIVGFVLSLIPIIITCFYSVPVYDDYNFGYYTHKSVVEGGSFFAGILTSVKEFYLHWQGFFTSNFWASSQLFNIDVNLYFFSNLAIIILVVLSLFYLGKVILIDLLKSDLASYFLIVIPIVSLYVQLMPSLSEGLYWMDGSLVMGINAISIFIISFTIKFYLSKTKKRKIIYLIMAIVSTLLICGSAIVVYITIMEFCTASLVYSIRKRNSVYKLIIAIMVIYTIGMIIALVAPGNYTRMNDVGNGMPLMNAIFYALFYSVFSFSNWTTLLFIIVMLLVSVVFYPIAKASKFKFKNPLLVFIMLYLLYASRMSIQLYAMGYLGSPRQMNEYYFGYILCISASILYFVGWISKRDRELFKKDTNDSRLSVVFVAVCLVIICCGGISYGIKNISTISTSMALINGSTQQYYKEMQERIEIYEDDSIKDVIVKPLSVYPAFFMDESLREDASYWTNSSVAKYYGKDSVVLSN